MSYDDYYDFSNVGSQVSDLCIMITEESAFTGDSWRVVQYVGDWNFHLTIHIVKADVGSIKMPDWIGVA